MHLIGIGIFIVAMVVFAICLVIPVTSEPGKDGWDDVH